MTIDLSNPIFHDEDAARADIEAVRWPDGPYCPHCGSFDTVAPLGGKSMGPGWYWCNKCREKFTVRVGTIFERSHLPLHKWRLAFQLLCASKKGMSANQLARMLNVSHQTAWFIGHRIRESMKDGGSGPLGGNNKVVEADETYVGGKAANRKGYIPPKAPVLALVERDGSVKAFRVANVTAKTLRPIIVKHVDRSSYMMTDESTVYPAIGREFSGHGSVNHSAQEYVRGTFWHTNTVENFFSILKRGINGVYHHVSEKHLDRYLAEFSFRYSNRIAFGIDDDMRTIAALKGTVGKRLAYRQPNKRTNRKASNLATPVPGNAPGD
jgi:transposase-like protein